MCGGDDAFAGLRYAAARLQHLLAPEHPVRCSGWPRPRDAAEALGELARLTEQVSALVEWADRVIGRELRDGRLMPGLLCGACAAVSEHFDPRVLAVAARQFNRQYGGSL